ncbi:bifunctional 5,10-methylenetetrahydrofolate dehydrogenase/5,10-methenyltetrahydrofolate cyclohydrolase [Croceicoccus marinus]|uniref:Bifunctional protein FolD n=2 Tax=Croceicoccus marinus TaxID=450378 RepID=A0A7G6W0M4_9SPHN|nr:bifunctional methylenetetrahydrofolate dehydrogenase/methenyltetrahydrofolate cyclohydrolase FolD [Croceicoccus marinus]QNE07539.1 bifunctional methylenetetrahydrofolate dehydrogenase/methenyltetrahydrofolate cyclohydrolase FolD [Croceicoccus marinus]
MMAAAPVPDKARLIDGKAIAAELLEKTSREVERIVADHGKAPALAVVLIGSDPASEVYVGRKIAQCRKAGITSIEHRLPEDTDEAALLSLIDGMNADPAIDGILIQLPLPKGIDAALVLDRISPHKDVDGFHPVNVGRLSSGTGGLVPCTPLGIMMLLDTVIDDYRGLDVVVIGKSNIVGKPVSMLLLEREATVTVTHVETRNLPDIARQADVIVAAAGVPHLVRGYWVKPGAVVIDVGITRVTEPDGTTRLLGDCATHELAHAAAVTPVPGGVGPMTIACLLSNTVRAARMARDA